MPRLVRIALISMLAAVCLPVLSSPADAATPTKNTLYVDDKIDADLDGSIKIKIGSSTTKIAKLTLKVRCEDGSKDKVVQKDIRLTSGAFEVVIGPGQSIAGAFTSNKLVSGKFRTSLCGFLSGEFDAKK